MLDASVAFASVRTAKVTSNHQTLRFVGVLCGWFSPVRAHPTFSNYADLKAEKFSHYTALVALLGSTVTCYVLIIVHYFSYDIHRTVDEDILV